MSTTQERFADFINYLKQSKMLESFEEFYADNIIMQENLNEPTVGKDANRQRELDFMNNVKEWKSFNITAAAASDTHSFYESDFSAITQDDQLVNYQQVSVQRWENGKIVHERFYYDSGAGS
jgi:hypothetical protein